MTALKIHNEISIDDENEICEQLNKAVDGIDIGSRWPAMSYEQGVEAALNWVLGDTESGPMDEDS